MAKTLRVGIIAGEASGDYLAAGLIQTLSACHPNIQFEGIAGPKMLKAGCNQLFSMEEIAVGGIFEIIGKLPKLLSLRSKVARYFIQNPPDVFIGVDAPDFNLPIEKKLKSKGIKTVHYVSPTVWAWRQGRIHSIAKSVDLMLTIFPFENAIYQENNIPVKFVGHPIAKDIPVEPDYLAAKKALSIPSHQKVVTLMPGSRSLELKFLSKLFIETAQWCLAKRPELIFIAPMVDEKRKAQMQASLSECGDDLPIRLTVGNARQVMAASDVILLASGTATLEGMLLKKPMVVAYKVSLLTYWVLKWLIKVPFCAMPNLLVGREVIPEYLQYDATAENLGNAVLSRIDDPGVAQEINQTFKDIHLDLLKDARMEASEAILALLNIKLKKESLQVGQ